MPEEKDEKRRLAESKRRYGRKGEKCSKDPFSGIFIGLILIWVGLLWFLRMEEILVTGKWWQWFLIGFGTIFILDRLIRYASPAHRRPMFGRIFLGLILIAIGVSFISGMETWWPLVVAIVGIAIIVYAIQRVRKSGT